MRQRELEIRLEAVPAHPSPTPALEQYRTPSRIAADMLYRALARGDIAGRRILELGCGTGIFAIGALLLGARAGHGVDVDEAAIREARKAAEAVGVPATFEVGDARDLRGDYDAVLMNPPFGAQFGARHLDTAFVESAIRLAPITYSLHLAETADHLVRLAARLGVHIEALAEYAFAIPAQFRFHTKERHEVRVALYRFSRAPT